VVLGLPALRGLRRRFPSADITLVAPMPQARVAQWENLVDRVVDFGDPALAGLIGGTAGEWPGPTPFPDVAVVWLRSHADLAATAERLGVKHTVGCAPLDAIPRRTHVSDWLTRSITNLGVVGSTPPATPERRAPGEVILHPGSGSAHKNWSSWREVIAALRPRRVTVPTGPADERAVETLLREWPTGVAAPEIMREQTLEELRDRLVESSLYLGNDSGVSHLAAALGVPSVVVFGPTDPEIWRPVGRHVNVLGGRRVEEGIIGDTAAWPSVNDVIAAARAQAE
jgi:heptosyltransferase-3